MVDGVGAPAPATRPPDSGRPEGASGRPSVSGSPEYRALAQTKESRDGGGRELFRPRGPVSRLVRQRQAQWGGLRRRRDAEAPFFRGSERVHRCEAVPSRRFLVSLAQGGAG